MCDRDKDNSNGVISYKTPPEGRGRPALVSVTLGGHQQGLLAVHPPSSNARILGFNQFLIGEINQIDP